MSKTSRTALAVTQTEESFTSEGVRCAATIYRPGGATGPMPVVVMAHGVTLTRRDGIPAFARHLAATGAQHDRMLPAGAVDKAIPRTPRAEVRRYPTDHFGPFSPEHHPAAAADASDFLRTHGSRPRRAR